jgi:hypothetical protein
MVPITIPPPFCAALLKEKWKVSAFTGHAAIETKNADKIGTMNRRMLASSGLSQTPEIKLDLSPKGRVNRKKLDNDSGSELLCW